MELIELNRYCFAGSTKTNFSCQTSDDGKIFILSENELVVLSFSPNMESDENKFKFDEYFITCTDYHIADQTDIKMEDVLYSLPKEKFYQLIMNEIFTPEFENTNPQITKPLLANWSPAGVFRNSDCALGIVTNTGNVEIYIAKADSWVCVSNSTKCLVECFKDSWVEETNSKQLSYEEISEIHEKRVLQCVATCFAWSPIYENESSRHVYIAVSYMTGNVCIWKYNCFDSFTSVDELIPPVIAASHNIYSTRITAIHWCRISTHEAWMVCGNIEGLVKAVLISSENDIELEIIKEVTIWEDIDIRASNILSFNQEKNSIFLIIKGQYIIIVIIDNENHILVELKFVNNGNLFISGIEKINSNSYLITTYTGVIKILDINITKNTEIKYEVKIVKTDIDWAPYGARGVLRSPDKHLWGILVFPCKIYDHLVFRKPIELVFCIQSNLDPGQILKDNESKSLYKHWEILEIMRCLSIKKDSLPSNWIVQCENFEDISLYELRIIYWLSLASYKIISLQQKSLAFYSKITDPELLEKVIYFKHHLQRLKKLIELHDAGEKLSKHQLNSLFMMKQNILSNRREEYTKDYFEKKFLEEDVDKIIEKASKLDKLAIPDCAVCNTPLTDGKCGKHPEDRCMISQVQIIFDSKWHCRYCRGIAHEDIEEESPFCIMCDIPLLPYDPYGE